MGSWGNHNSESVDVNDLREEDMPGKRRRVGQEKGAAPERLPPMFLCHLRHLFP